MWVCATVLGVVPQSIDVGSYCPEQFAVQQWFKQGLAGACGVSGVTYTFQPAAWTLICWHYVFLRV